MSAEDAFGAYLTPVLANPKLEDVRLALESRDDELAALTLTELLNKDGPPEPERSRWYYLLGVIEERRGESVRSRNAFREASAKPGPLQLDALIHIARLASASKDCALLRQILEDATDVAEAQEAVVLLKGELAVCEDRKQDAKHAFETAIQGARQSRLRALYQARLAEVLSAALDPCDVRQKSAIDEVAELVQQAKALAGSSESVNVKLSNVVRQVTCPRLATLPDGLRLESLAYVDELLELRRWDEAKPLLTVWEVETSSEPDKLATLCRVQFAQGRLASGIGKPLEAIERFDWVVAHCTDTDLSARALFLGAAQLTKVGKFGDAMSRYADIERRFPEHRLADDACLKTAFLYRRLGSEKRYLELLGGMAELYPTADMTQEGLFFVALESMLKKDWGAALSALNRADAVAKGTGVIRDAERDRLSYFLARVKLFLGQKDDAIPELRSLVMNRPLTYYMLLADAALREVSAEVANAAIDEGVRLAASEPAPSVADYRTFGSKLKRVMALLSVGDLAFASERMLGLETPNETPEAYWAMVGLYVEAGAIQTALTLVKSRTEDYRIRWPTGNWFRFWSMVYPTPYATLVARESARTNVESELIYAIMREESLFNSGAVSHAKAYGLMQLIVPTATTAARGTGKFVSSTGLLKPELNVFLGARVLKGLLERFQGQVPLAIAGYNAGPGRPARWLKERPEAPLDLWVEAIEYPETRNYVKRVLSSRAAYRWLYATERQRGTVAPLNLALVGP
jgi:soluble lytic murein transglycosylase